MLISGYQEIAVLYIAIMFIGLFFRKFIIKKLPWNVSLYIFHLLEISADLNALPL